MSPDIAKAALALLARAQLQGAEVDAYVTVRAALEALANPQELPAPKAE